MKLSAFKQQLASASDLHFIQPDGQPVPAHFHVTEMGLTTKHFIDCGGTVREERKASFQIWVAEDTHHRLAPHKMLGIIDKAAPLMDHTDPEIEVEYQGETVGKYALDLHNGAFVLVATQTDCLAKETCGVEPAASKAPAFAIVGSSEGSCCTPGSGCC